MTKADDLICMVVPYFDRIGGYELQAFSLCKAYHSFGKRSVILTTYTPGNPYYEIRDQIPIYRVPQTLERWGGLSFYLPYFFWKFKQMPTILHCHSHSLFTEQILQVNRYLKIPVILKVATQGDIKCLQAEILASKKNIHRKKNYDQVTFISINSQIKQELLEFDITENKIIHIPNGVDTVRFSPVSPQEKNKIKQELGYKEKDRLISFVGRFEERKRVIDLIYAWKKIEKSYPQHCLVLVGDGEERNFYEESCIQLNIQKRVTFMGLSSCVEKILKITDLFVFPSRLEGLPNVLLEAMATGLPILTTDIPGINELIESEKTGLLVPPQDEAALIQGLHYMLINQQRAKDFGIAARQKILSDYCFTRMVPQFFDLYRRMSYFT